MGFWFVCLVLGLLLVCLFGLLAWLSDVVFASSVLVACAQDVGFVLLAVVLLLIRCFLLWANASSPCF